MNLNVIRRIKCYVIRYGVTDDMNSILQLLKEKPTLLSLGQLWLMLCGTSCAAGVLFGLVRAIAVGKIHKYGYLENAIILHLWFKMAMWKNLFRNLRISWSQFQYVRGSIFWWLEFFLFPIHHPCGWVRPTMDPTIYFHLYYYNIYNNI